MDNKPDSNEFIDAKRTNYVDGPKQKVVNSIDELFAAYEDIKKAMGCFIMIGVPIPDDGRINFKCDMWINKMVQQPNIISHRYRSRFCSMGYHAIINNVLDRMPFVSHILLMDADEWPVDSNCIQKMVDLDKDIVVGATPICTNGKGICWNVNRYSEYAEEYWPDFLRWEYLPDEPFRVNFSGGPWLVKREVFEKLEYPYFKDVFDKEHRKVGQDIYFDIQAQRAGFEIWCHPGAKFNHERNVNLYDAMAYRDEPDTHGLYFGGWAIDSEDWQFIRNIIEKEGLKYILEFGSGLSTLLMADIGCFIDSYDEDIKYARERVRSRNSSPQIHLFEWDCESDFLERADPDEKYDLVFIDGPVSKEGGGKGREAAFRIASEYANRIICHDAQRDEEREYQEKYLKPNFKLEKFNNNCAYWVRKDG